MTNCPLCYTGVSVNSFINFFQIFPKLHRQLNPLPTNETTTDVQEWLKKEKLDDLCATMDGLEGSHLEEMYRDLIRNPDKFKDEMRSDYQMKGKMCLKFTVALKRLFQQQFDLKLDL